MHGGCQVRAEGKSSQTGGARGCERPGAEPGFPVRWAGPT